MLDKGFERTNGLKRIEEMKVAAVALVRLAREMCE